MSAISDASEKRWEETCNEVRKISASHTWHLTENKDSFPLWKCKICGLKGSTHIEAPFFALDCIPREVTDGLPLESFSGPWRNKLFFTCEQEQARKRQAKEKNKIWSVYILECFNDYWYTGVTNNIWDRFKAHSLRKGAKFTIQHPPKKFVYIEHCNSKSDALKREWAIKQLSKAEKVVMATLSSVPPEYNMVLRR